MRSGNSGIKMDCIEFSPLGSYNIVETNLMTWYVFTKDVTMTIKGGVVMANSKRICKYHGKTIRNYIVVNNMAFCSYDYAAKWGYENKLTGKKRVEQSQRKKDKKRLKELMSRSDWFKKLERVVNQYVKHVKEKDKPCCTCGTSNNKIDAGHFRSVGSCPELRFELTNIHNQCSVNCNQFGSGKRAEYNEYIINRYGVEHYNWLIGPHPSLKEQFTTWQDIEDEIKRYRKLLRAEGLTPNS